MAAAELRADRQRRCAAQAMLGICAVLPPSRRPIAGPGGRHPGSRTGCPGALTASGDNGLRVQHRMRCLAAVNLSQTQQTAARLVCFVGSQLAALSLWEPLLKLDRLADLALLFGRHAEVVQKGQTSWTAHRPLSAVGGVCLIACAIAGPDAASTKHRGSARINAMFFVACPASAGRL